MSDCEELLDNGDIDEDISDISEEKEEALLLDEEGSEWLDINYDAEADILELQTDKGELDDSSFLEEKKNKSDRNEDSERDVDKKPIRRPISPPDNTRRPQRFNKFTRGNGRRNPRNRTVLINPRFKGVVHVSNNARLAWDHQGPAQINPWATGTVRNNHQFPVANQQQFQMQHEPQHFQQQQQPVVLQVHPYPNNNFVQSPPPLMQQLVAPPNYQICVTNQPRSLTVHDRLGDHNRQAAPAPQYQQTPIIINTALPPPGFHRQCPPQPHFEPPPQFQQPAPLFQSSPHQLQHVDIFNRDMNINRNFPQNNDHNTLSNFNNNSSNRVTIFNNRNSNNVRANYPNNRTNYVNKKNNFGNRIMTNNRKRPTGNVQPQVKPEEVHKVTLAVPEDIEEDAETRQYRLQIEEQKRQREKILFEKEQRRKQQAAQNADQSTEPLPQQPNVIPRGVKPIVQRVNPNRQKPQNNSAPQHKKPILQRVNSIPAKTNLTQRVVVLNKPRFNPTPNNINIQCVEGASFESEGANTANQNHLSTFLNDRTILTKDQSLVNTRLVVVNNLCGNTSNKKILGLCREIGEVQKLHRDKAGCKATILFKSVASAHAFYKKYQRYMLDLSMIEVKLKPMSSNV